MLYNIFMEKNMLIATVLNEHARVYLLNSKEIVEKARKIHDLWPTSCAALGRCLSATVLLAMNQKDENEEVTVTINGNGPIGRILCTGSSSGMIKGYCDNPHIYETYPDSHKLAVGLAVGTDGYLSVSKNLKLKQSYTSQVELQTGEIGDDFVYYFAVSQQIPALVSLGVLVDTDDSVKSAGAMIIELLPNHTEKDIEYLESLNLKPISSVLDENPDIHDYLFSLFKDAKILDEKYVEYHCDCSKDRFTKKLLTLNSKDLNEILNDKHLDITCEFCKKNYHYDIDDIKQILDYVSDSK